MEKSVLPEDETEADLDQEAETQPRQQKAPEERAVDSDQVDSLILAFAKEKKASEECMNRLKYLQADFDNYAKRMDRQMDEIKRRTAESIYAGLLEVLDELELALRNGRSTNSTTVLMEGVDMTLKKLKKMLASEGIAEIAGEGQAFDPKVHSAVCAVPCEGMAEGVVVEELRKGYTLQGRVLRPAMVKVSIKGSRSNETCQKKGSNGK